MLVSRPVVLEWLRGPSWVRAMRILAPLGAFWLEGWPALIGAVLIQEGGMWLAGRLTDVCQRHFARRLFVAAYALRVFVILPTHYVARLGDGNGALFRDDYTNDLVGEWLVRIARGDGTLSIFPGHQHLLDGIYPYLLMGIYAVFGYTPMLPKLLNSALAALSAVVVFDTGRRAFRPSVAILAAAGAAIVPTLVIWSIVSLKETLVLFVALVGLWMVQFLTTASRRDRHFGDALLVLLGVLVLLVDLRATAAIVFALLVAIVAAARSNLAARPWRLGLAVLAVAIVAGGGLWFARVRTSTRPVTALAEDVMLQIRHHRAQEAASARSQLRQETDVFTATGRDIPAAEAASDAAPFTLTGDVLDPLANALLAPTPWQARSLPELAASAEMPVWYVLIAASLFAWRASARQPLFVVCLVVYGVANWIVLAASEGNVGNLLRHRLLLDPVLLLLGAAGLDVLWSWARSARGMSRLVQVPPQPQQRLSTHE